MLRTVGFHNILISVLCLRQGWFVAYQLVRKVLPFMFRGFWVMTFFGLFCFFLVLCALLGLLAGPVSFCGVQGLGLVGVPFFGFVLWAFSDFGITCLTSGETMGKFITQVIFFCFGFLFLGFMYFVSLIC